MVYGHRYEAVNDQEAYKDADPSSSTEKLTGNIKDEALQLPQRVHVSVSWWKFLLGNLIAALVGAGAMLLVARGVFGEALSQSASSAAAVTPVVTATVTAPASVVTVTTSVGKITLETPHPELKEGEITTPNKLSGVILDCGGNPEEARAKDCVYDVMMQDWVPRPCYDEVLTEQYLKEGNWTWYATGDGDVIMSDEEMRKGEHGKAWMSTSYHKAHCVFSWLKIIRALRNGQGLSQELISYDHVLHCKHGALKGASDDESLGVMAPTNYARCALYETWKQNFPEDQHDTTSK